MSINTAQSNDFQIPSIRVIFGQQAEKANPIKGRLPKSEKTKKTFSVEGDRVTLSEEAKKALFQQKSAKTEEKNSLDSTQLDAGEKREVQKLKKRDAKVRRHEMAHKMAGGSITGQIVYEYEKGPDGKRYVTDGHISIDTSTESTPEATLRKASSIRRAALAPSDPSPADRRVAGKAQRMAARARQEITEERQEAMTEQMERINNSLSSGGSGIDVNLSALGGIQLDVKSPFQKNGEKSQNSVQNISPQSFKTKSQINSALQVNASQQKQSSSPPKQKIQNIKIRTSAPSKDRLSQTEEEIQEEVVPEEAL